MTRIYFVNGMSVDVSTPVEEFNKLVEAAAGRPNGRVAYKGATIFVGHIVMIEDRGDD